MPARIDWKSVDVAAWQAHWHDPSSVELIHDDPTQQFRHWARCFDHSLNGFVSTPSARPPSQWLGRGQHLRPTQCRQQAPLRRSSRHGDQCLRTDFASRGVQLWFRQLRRLQALHQNLQKNDQNPNAMAYRLECWSSILRGKGFVGGFVQWWPTRRIKLQGSPTSLEMLVPSSTSIARMFEDFTLNFRQYESWNCRKQREISRARIQAFRHQIFQRIRSKTKDYVDTLVESADAEILAVSERGDQIQLERPLGNTIHDHLSWWIDDFNEIKVEQISEDLYQVVDADCLIQAGQLLTCKSYCTEVTTIHRALGEFWTQRWSKHANIPASDWNRILSFGRAFLPRRPMPYQPLDLVTWDAANARYTDRSARGADGFHPHDLVVMPRAFKLALLQLLHSVENQATAWPQQLLTGFTACLAKTVDAAAVSQFRPLVIFPAIYRSWATARAKPLLAHIAELATDTQFGFMPGRECLEITFMIQALVELMALSQSTMQGLVTDIQKAFENIPRFPVLQLARHIGAPKPVLQAWETFMDTMERRFQVRGDTGPAHTSSAGVPEGCALSCVAMSVIDLAFHYYMKCFAPQVIPLSFVDNLGLLAVQVGDLFRSTVILQEFMAMWQLDLDHRKTWTWSTSMQDHQELHMLGYEVKTHASDLGAQLSYTGRRHIDHVQARIDSLHSLWPRLRRMEVHDELKRQLLVAAFWPRALHGTALCLLGGTHLSSLRTQAVRALGYGRAGAAPLLRMALSPNLKSDPGFYHLVLVLDSFRRIAGKQEQLLTLWRDHHRLYRGVLKAGPFSKLYEVLSPLSWTLLEPPWIQPRTGAAFDLLQIPATILYRMLETTWMEVVSASVRHRADFRGVNEIDRPTLLRAQKALTPLALSQVTALQEGVFLTGRQQSKFDRLQSGMCPWCDVVDDLDHRCTVCQPLHAARAKHVRILQEWPHLPVSLRHRLLPERFPAWDSWVQSLGELAVPRFDFALVADPNVPWTDIFTDGSCLRPEQPECSLAAWACVSATHGKCLVAAPLYGPCQNIDRSETMALVAAATWAAKEGAAVAIWSDSAYATTGLTRLLAHPEAVPYDTNSDLWYELQGLLHAGVRLQCQHVAAHRNLQDSKSPVDDWTLHWNNAADKAAKAAHCMRAPSVLAMWRSLCAHQDRSLRLLLDLQALHTEVASARQVLLKQPLDEDAVTERQNSDDHVQVVALSEGSSWWAALPSDWLVQLQASPSTFGFGLFGLQMVQKLLQIDTSPETFEISWLELALWTWDTFRGRVPTAGLRKDEWVTSTSTPELGYAPQTLASVLRYVRGWIRCVASVLSLQVVEVRGINLASCGVAPPQNGAAFQWPRSVVIRTRLLLCEFCGKRPIRTVNDLTRPLKATWLLADHSH